MKCNLIITGFFLFCFAGSIPAQVLFYALPGAENITGFHSNITVAEGSDMRGVYYRVCAFPKGHCGLTVTPGGERMVFFNVADKNGVYQLAKGEHIEETYGSDSLNGYSYWGYDWKPGETYRFFITAVADSAAQTTDYTAYFFTPRLQQWKLIATFRTKGINYFTGLYSASDLTTPEKIKPLQQVYFGNQWMQNEKREWKELNRVRFDDQYAGGETMDARTKDSAFLLLSGSAVQPRHRIGDSLTRTATTKPGIDLYRNVDSAAQAERDKKTIAEYCQRTKMNCSSKEGIYYYIINTGRKPYAKLDDELVVYYRGTLVDGTVFDKTDDEPRTFPLKRLIKGWQTGLQLIGEGGRMQLMIPSAHGYSIRHLGTIPPNSVLIFDIEIEKIKN